MWISNVNLILGVLVKAISKLLSRIFSEVWSYITFQIVKQKISKSNLNMKLQKLSTLLKKLLHFSKRQFKSYLTNILYFISQI